MRYYYITDSKTDIENFKTKFGTDDKGRDIYSLFIKYKDRLKNHGISNDITYHTKHTSKEEMLDILYRMDNQDYENEKGEINKSNYRKVYENNNWRIVEPLDWQTSMALGEGTTWCITGRYNTGGEVKPSQAEKYFNEYLVSYYKTYYFVYDKKNGEKYCICPKTRGDVDIWNEEDNLINSGKLLRSIGEEGVESMNLYIDFPDENGFVIENGVLKEYEGNKKEIVIPNGVEEIGDSVFDACRSLQFVTIPGSVKKIGENAFYNCYSLQSIIVSNGVKEIGNFAFAYCSSLQSITIPGSIKEIGENAFNNCDSLKSVIISNGVKKIGHGAFAYCYDLQSVTIPNSVEEIGDDAFMDCDSLKSITIPNGVKKIEHGAFAYCNSLQSITIPGSVKEIEDGVFNQCTSLQSITILNGVEKIGENIFVFCDSLQSVTIPESVKEIGEYAFHGCDSLRSIYVNDEKTADVILKYNPRVKDKIVMFR